MLNQKYDDRSREQINRLESQLAKTIAEMDVLKTKHDLLWEQIFSAFDQAEGEGVGASFVCDDGYKLMRVVPNMQPVIDSKKMEEVLMDFANGALWKRVTDVVRVVNPDKLAKEMNKFPVLAEKIAAAEAIKTPVRKPSRKRDEANKEERMWLEHELKQKKAV